MTFPFCYGLVNVSMLGAIYGAFTTGLAFTTLWSIFGYAKAADQSDSLVQTLATTVRSYNQQRTALRVAQTTRDETREKMTEVLGELDASREMVDDLLAKIGTLTQEVAEGKTKDALIAALRRRVENISAEYNDKHLKRKAVTLEDVYRLTGEADVS